MRLFSFDHPEHRDTIRLLPWYVNGTLDSGERARVDLHVRECVACRRELQSQLHLRDMVRGESAQPALASALARMHADIDTHRAAGAASVSRHKQRAWWRRPRLPALLIASQFVIIVALLLRIAPHHDAAFRTLSAPAPTAPSGDAVVVIFDPTATQQRVQALLRDVDARIVDGPNKHGAYTLELPRGMQQATLQRLRNLPDVRFAQPAPGSTGMAP